MNPNTGLIRLERSVPDVALIGAPRETVCFASTCGIRLSVERPDALPARVGEPVTLALCRTAGTLDSSLVAAGKDNGLVDYQRLRAWDVTT
jgi:hypothetical protein